MEFSDVFSTIIPEITPCNGFDQKSRYHVYDVWGHIAHAVERSKPDKYVRLALLFHDIAKPAAAQMMRVTGISSVMKSKAPKWLKRLWKGCILTARPCEM